MLYVVVIAAFCLLLLSVYDKRASIINSAKKVLFKPKKIKVPKIKKEPVQVSEPVKDTDSEVIEENVSYGEFNPQEHEPQQEALSYEELFPTSTIFTPEQKQLQEEQQFDIDTMLQEIEDERRHDQKIKYASDMLDGEILPDFESMSMADLDNLLEQSLNTDDQAFLIGSTSSSKELAGERLGNMLKDLPKELKILIATDIFKRKF